ARARGCGAVHRVPRGVGRVRDRRRRGREGAGVSKRVYNKDTGKYDLIKGDWWNAKVIVGRAGVRAYPEYLVNDSRLTEGYFRAPDGTLFDASEISLCHVVIDEHGNNVAVE